MSSKIFTAKEWRAMKVVALANTKHGVIKEDSEGRLWEWESSGKRVNAIGYPILLKHIN